MSASTCTLRGPTLLETRSWLAVLVSVEAMLLFYANHSAALQEVGCEPACMLNGSPPMDLTICLGATRTENVRSRLEGRLWQVACEHHQRQLLLDKLLTWHYFAHAMRSRPGYPGSPRTSLPLPEPSTNLYKADGTGEDTRANSCNLAPET